MRDFIFIIGASGIGKTTLAKKLYEHYKGAYVEMSMIPEFGVPEGVDEGLFEEQVLGVQCDSSEEVLGTWHKKYCCPRL